MKHSSDSGELLYPAQWKLLSGRKFFEGFIKWQGKEAENQKPVGIYVLIYLFIY